MSVPHREGPRGQTGPRPLAELVEEGWAAALAPVAPRIARLGELLRAEVAAGRPYLPAGADVLRGFTQPFDDVRGLIGGQDAHPAPGQPPRLSRARVRDGCT